MKKSLLFILFLSLIFCAGCTANYTVTIDEDGKVEERLSAKEDEEFFENYPHSSKGLVISYVLDPYIDELNSNNYSVDSSITKQGGGVVISKKYDSLEDYIENSIIYRQFTNEINLTKNGDKMSISLEGKFSHSEQNQQLIPVDSGTITIELPFKVSENNADEEEGNTYIWNFTKADDDLREIKLIYNGKKLNKKTDFTILIVLGLLGVLLAIGFLIYSKIMIGKSNVNKI